MHCRSGCAVPAPRRPAARRQPTAGSPRFTPHPCLAIAVTARQASRVVAGGTMEAAEYDRMDAVEQDMWWYRALHRRLLAAVTEVRGALLDAGCGTGGLLARLRASRPDLRL